MESQKSEQMINIEKEIEVNGERSRALIECRRAVCSFKPQTDEGREALSKEVSRIETQLDAAQRQYNELRSQLEIETVKYLGGGSVLAAV